MAWKDELTDEQKRAASHTGKHARLLAGPGTGKTHSLTRRVLYLVEEKGVEPNKILVLTFTRAATAELKNRVKTDLGDKSQLLHISTLHSFALKTILKHSAEVRLPQPIRIADDHEERWIIQEDLKRILGLSRVNEAADLLAQLSADWEQLSADAADWERRFPNPRFLGAWQEHRQIYGYTLRSELVYQLKHALTEGALQVESPPEHLLVDEYQDLNACDLAVIKALVQRGAELFCAGDDDQSIYGFRYANPDGIRRFDREYTPCASLELAECKRCDRRILDLALYIARQDPRRIDKPIHSASNAGDGEVHILRFDNQDDEADGIAKICAWLTKKKGILPEEVLILLRSDYNGQFSKPIREVLEARGLEVAKVSDPLEPLNCPTDDTGKRQSDGRIFLCLLRLIVNPQDHLAWRTLLELQDNGLGDKAMNGLYELARKKGKTFFDTLQLVKSDPALLPRFGRKIKEEVEAIESRVAGISPTPAVSLGDFIRALAAKLIADSAVRKAVCGVFERILEVADVDDLDGLLRAINVSLGEAEQDRQKGAVNLMTMHQAKGLSADAVFVVAAEDEYLPGRSTGDRADDERRLLYVSVTRARHYLFLTHCNRRTGPQRHTGRASGQMRRTLSRFLSGGPFQSEDGASFVSRLR